MRPKSWLVMLTTMLAALGAPAQAAEAGTVRMGQIGLSFYAVTGAVVQTVLERLGHTVEVSTGSHAQIFPRLGAGEVDLLVAAWLPHGHAVYWEQYGARAKALGVLYEGARFYWVVPAYVPETAVASVEDLTKPDVLARIFSGIIQAYQATDPASVGDAGDERLPLTDLHALIEGAFSL